MPAITVNLTQVEMKRLLDSLPPDYTGDVDGAKQLVADCLKERVRAYEQTLLNKAVRPGTPSSLVVT